MDSVAEHPFHLQHDSVAYDLVKTRLLELEAEVEEYKPITMLDSRPCALLVLLLLLHSSNLVFTG